jgi:hypothetical protein
MLVLLVMAVTGAVAQNYKVSVKEGTTDATSWTIAPAEATTTGVAQGTEVTATYSGTKKVKSVKAKKKAATAPAAAIAPALMDGATVVIECNCDGFVTYFTFTNNGGTYSCNITGDESDYFSASLTKQGNTLVFVAQHSDMPDSFDSTINFDTTSDTYSFAKKAEDFFYFKISVNGTDITDKLSETAPTLAETMTTAGMTVKVKYNFFREELNYCQFLSNGDGTYTFQSGTGDLGGDEDGDHHDKALVVEGGKLVFKQSYYTFDFEWDKVGYSVTFDTSNNTYSEWWGKDASEDEYSFISVEVNGTQIAVTAAQ